MNNKSVVEYRVSPLKFALLTFIISWVSWGIILIANQFGHLEYGTPLMLVFFGTGGVSPAIVAFALLVRSGQSSGKDLVKRIFDFRQPPILYIVVIGIAVLVYVIPLLLNKGVQVAPFYMAIVLIPFDLIGGGLEEIGWRFIFQPTLEKKMPFVVATLITGIVWALWHLPLFIMEGTMQLSESFMAFTIYVIGMAFVSAAIYRVSKSVLLCILFHTVSNAVGETIAVDFEIGIAAGMCIALVVVSFLLIRIFDGIKRKRGGRYDY